MLALSRMHAPIWVPPLPHQPPHRLYSGPLPHVRASVATLFPDMAVAALLHSVAVKRYPNLYYLPLLPTPTTYPYP